MAVSTMDKDEIEKEYGPIQLLNTLEQAMKDLSLTKRDYS